jgi:hypothetical protein
VAFTIQEIENIANAAIDFHFQRGTITSSNIQNKPLLKRFMAKVKTFPGGQGNVTVRVKGAYSTTIQGFNHDDSVGYVNPANIKTASYPWKLIHAGISFSMHELIKDGISVTDSVDGKNTSRHTDREMTALANLLDDKLEDMQEGVDRGFNTMFWKDGTQDATQVPGLLSIVLDSPTSSATVGGIDQTQTDPQTGRAWWQNRASLAIDISTKSNLNLTNKLQYEFRQLKRFGGRPNLFLAGSNFLDGLEQELRSKGNFTLEGWAKGGRMDASIVDLAFKGLEIEYDPTLDDLGRGKYGYVLDDRHIYPMVVDGENMKKHAPARPENKYVFYRAVTWAGALVCNQRNCLGVYSIA